MIKIDKLYSEPEAFHPITFDYGINIIMGEKSETSDKKIGVGKSISIEFLNYCLLKKFSESRVALIPRNVLDPGTNILLDLSFNSQKLTIIRSVSNPEKVTIFIDGNEINFEKADDASDYLGNLYFRNFPSSFSRISFRNLLAPVIRDERSEFKDIIKCFDTNSYIPRDYKPHLFFLGLNTSLYSEVEKTIQELDRKTTYASETKKLIAPNGERISDVKAHVNELESEVAKINASIENLKNNESFDVIQAELIKLESQLSELRTKQKAIRYEIKQIESLPQPENISANEMRLLFDQFKDGLGEIVEKSIVEVKQFKEKIDSFRNTLVNSRLEDLKIELAKINELVRKCDEETAEKVRLLDSNGEFLKDLRVSIKIFESKNRELNNLRSLIDRYDVAERDKKRLQTKKSNLIAEFDEMLITHQNIIESFKNTVLSIHEKIMGNREAHFEIRTIDKARRKEFIEFVLRIDDDGSHTTERMKVFIYDVALMLNSFTKQNHPQFLVHDNLFEDDDSLEKSLNYLYYQHQNGPYEFQYILTLNRDMIESMEEKDKLLFDIDTYKRATFTKDNRFLGIKYTEGKRKNDSKLKARGNGA